MQELQSISANFPGIAQMAQRTRNKIAPEGQAAL
jgi:hypothetical protein